MDRVYKAGLLGLAELLLLEERILRKGILQVLVAEVPLLGEQCAPAAPTGCPY